MTLKTSPCGELLVLNWHTKFEVPSFAHSTHMMGHKIFKMGHVT